MVERETSNPSAHNQSIDVLAYVAEHGGAAELSPEQLREINYVRPNPNVKGYIMPEKLLERQPKLVDKAVKALAEAPSSTAMNYGWDGPCGIGAGKIPGYKAAAYFSGQRDN